MRKDFSCILITPIKTNKSDYSKLSLNNSLKLGKYFLMEANLFKNAGDSMDSELKVLNFCQFC